MGFNVNEFRDLDPGERILMGPGPSNVHPRVLQAMAAPCIGHLDPAFLSIMDDAQRLLRYLFQTENALTIPVSGTGSSGMETCFVNVLEPGDEVVVCVNGDGPLTLKRSGRRFKGGVPRSWLLSMRRLPPVYVSPLRNFPELPGKPAPFFLWIQ